MNVGNVKLRWEGVEKRKKREYLMTNAEEMMHKLHESMKIWVQLGKQGKREREREKKKTYI